MNQHLIKEIQQLKQEVAQLKEVDRKIQGIQKGPAEDPRWPSKENSLEDRIKILEDCCLRHNDEINRITNALTRFGASGGGGGGGIRVRR